MNWSCAQAHAERKQQYENFITSEQSDFQIIHERVIW